MTACEHGVAGDCADCSTARLEKLRAQAAENDGRRRRQNDERLDRNRKILDERGLTGSGPAA